MNFTGKLNASGPIGSYYGQLAAMLRKEIPTTVRFEAAATVRRAMQMVKSSKVTAVKERALKKGVARFRTEGVGGSVDVGKKSRFGQIWMVGAAGNGFTVPIGEWDGSLGPLQDHQRATGGADGWHTSDANWTMVKAAWAANARETKKKIQAKLGARGITAKSWYEILQKIGAGDPSAGVPAYVQRARPINGISRGAGFAVATGEGTSQFQITVINTSGTAIATGGERKLNAAIAMRRAAFMNAMNKNLFFDAKFVARNYPWAKVT